MKLGDIAMLLIGAVVFTLIAGGLYLAFAHLLPWVVEVLQLNGVKLP